MPPTIFAAALLALITAVPARSEPVAFVGAEIIAIAGDPLTNGVLLVDHGKIVAVGAADQVEIPQTRHVAI